MTPRSTPAAEPSFGQRLKQMRELAKPPLKQSELATRAGLTPAALSQIEAGERNPSFKTLRQLADALHTSVGALLGEAQPNLPPAYQAFFRDLEKLNSADLDKVRDYAAFLQYQARSKDVS